jgi:hypothetical protein
MFFDFVEDFVRGMHLQFTLDNLQKYMQALVERVLSDLESIKQLQIKHKLKTLDLSKNEIKKPKKGS